MARTGPDPDDSSAICGYFLFWEHADRGIEYEAFVLHDKPPLKTGNNPGFFISTNAFAYRPLLYQAVSHRKQRRSDENANEAEGEHPPNHAEQAQDKRQVAAAAD